MLDGKAMAPPSLATSLKSAKRSVYSTFDEAAEIAQHTVAFIAAILSIWCVHVLLDRLLGVDAKFYDRIPVRYVIDTGHLAVLIRFVWKLVEQIWKKK